MSFDKNKDHSQIMGGGLEKWLQNGKFYDRDFKEVKLEKTEVDAPVAMPSVQLKDFKPTPEPTAPKPEASVVVEAPEVKALDTEKASIKDSVKAKKTKKAKATLFGARDE